MQQVIELNTDFVQLLRQQRVKKLVQFLQLVSEDSNDGHPIVAYDNAQGREWIECNGTVIGKGPRVDGPLLELHSTTVGPGYFRRDTKDVDCAGLQVLRDHSL